MVIFLLEPLQIGNLFTGATVDLNFIYLRRWRLEICLLEALEIDNLLIGVAVEGQFVYWKLTGVTKNRQFIYWSGCRMRTYSMCNLFIEAAATLQFV